jgi:ketosteroid isomerase-like protein
MPDRPRPPRRFAPLTAALGGAAAAVAGRAAYTGAIRALLRHNVAALQAGDPAPLLRLYASDATLVFPGRHSWGRTYRGRDEIEAFLRRFLAAGLRGELGAIVIDGPPWRTTIAVEFEDEARDGAGKRIYENRAVIVLRTRWGKVVTEEVYEDTQAVAAFDEQLDLTAPAPTAPAVA